MMKIALREIAMLFVVIALACELWRTLSHNEKLLIDNRTQWSGMMYVYASIDGEVTPPEGVIIPTVNPEGVLQEYPR